jgi:hypothetical protein
MSQLVLCLSSEDLYLGDEDLDNFKGGLEERLDAIEVLGMSAKPDLSVSVVIRSTQPQDVVEAVREAFDDIEIFEGVLSITLQAYDPDDDPDLTAPPCFERLLDLEASSTRE